MTLHCVPVVISANKKLVLGRRQCQAPWNAGVALYVKGVVTSESIADLKVRARASAHKYNKKPADLGIVEGREEQDAKDTLNTHR